MPGPASGLPVRLGLGGQAAAEQSPHSLDHRGIGQVLREGLQRLEHPAAGTGLHQVQRHHRFHGGGKVDLEQRRNETPGYSDVRRAVGHADAVREEVGVGRSGGVQLWQQLDREPLDALLHAGEQIQHQLLVGGSPRCESAYCLLSGNLVFRLVDRDLRERHQFGAGESGRLVDHPCCRHALVAHLDVTQPDLEQGRQLPAQHVAEGSVRERDNGQLPLGLHLVHGLDQASASLVLHRGERTLRVNVRYVS